MFRDTNLRKLSLCTADAASHASLILPTLSTLETLQIRGSYLDRCDLELPLSLQKLTFQECYCSPEWLCILIIALSSIGHHIECELDDLELQSSDTVNTSSSQLQASELTTNLMQCDMSNIELHVKTCSRELFEMFRDTNIRTLALGTAAAVSHISQILPTLSKLETLDLSGSYLERCDLQLPLSLQTLYFLEGYCSPEWLCTLIIALSSLGHHIVCVLFNLELQSSSTVNTSSSQLQASELTTNLTSCDMSNIELRVKIGSRELFGMFRETNIRTLWLGTADAVSHASLILHSAS
ncbi:hypothetical protein DPMN_164134 [Dreissena polymorpha]|uniref:Uncharacterized protein n=1 Tax=Dreissena polymorpha TaxID=45954 RepID=A0A9D4IV40_DREPO|nr:hypothetical protein DPMN_164134 [Dreissena polymorpha]